MTGTGWRTWALIAAGYAIGIAGGVKLTETVPHFEAALIAMLLPSTAAVIYLSATVILAKDTSTAGDGSLTDTYERILFGIVLFVVALHASIIAALAGPLPQSSWLPRVPIVMFGLVGIYIGNLLPRTRPNLAFGIRTRRTLADRDAWIRTHRVAGYLAVALGVLFVAGGLFLSKQLVEIVLGPASIAAAFLLAAEHLRRPPLNRIPNP